MRHTSSGHPLRSVASRLPLVETTDERETGLPGHMLPRTPCNEPRRSRTRDSLGEINPAHRYTFYEDWLRRRSRSIDVTPTRVRSPLYMNICSYMLFLERKIIGMDTLVRLRAYEIWLTSSLRQPM